MKPIFIDVQGFKSDNNKFIVKELAILKNETEINHFIFYPPYNWNLLSSEMKKQIYWLKKFHHGFSWQTGYTSYKLLNIIFVNLLSKEQHTNVYVKGNEKKKWILEIYPSINVKNIDEDNCKFNKNIKLIKCSLHNGVCAINNVFHMKQWWENETVEGRENRNLKKKM